MKPLAVGIISLSITIVIVMTLIFAYRPDNMRNRNIYDSKIANSHELANGSAQKEFLYPHESTNIQDYDYLPEGAISDKTMRQLELQTCIQLLHVSELSTQDIMVLRLVNNTAEEHQYRGFVDLYTRCGDVWLPVPHVISIDGMFILPAYILNPFSYVEMELAIHEGIWGQLSVGEYAFVERLMAPPLPSCDRGRWREVLAVRRFTVS